MSPVGSVQVSTDTPTLTVRNARDFNAGQAEYMFRILSPSGGRELAALTVPAGARSTSVALSTPLPRGIAFFVWSVTARNATRTVSSAPATFRPPSIACLSGRDPFAKSIVDWFVPACSLAQNHYNDPLQILGPPDAGGRGPDSYFGFISLGDQGYVTVDMEACATDQPGPDVRVFQSVSREPVTLYAAGTPSGPFALLQSRQPCGNRIPGVFSGYCDFDLADAEIQEARYFKIEDGEHFPCPGDTVTEGADVDAFEILHQRP